MGRSTPSGSRRKIANSDGVTLVEMLVAIAAASILIVFFFQADVALRRSAYGWIKQASLEETAILLRQQLGKDLLAIDSVLRTDDKRLEFKKSGGQTVTYDFGDHSILRNGQSVLSKAVRLEEADITHTAVGLCLRLTLTQGGERRCQITLPVRPWKQRTLERSDR